MKATERKTLEQLEDDVWPAPKFGSYLVTTCHQLRQKPLNAFTVEDLRIMIGQGIGIKFLLPKAIETLKVNPFSEGDFYQGDLLVQVLKLDPCVLKADPALYQDLIHASLAALQSLDPVLSNTDRARVERFLEHP